MFAVVVFKEYSLENCSAGWDYTIDVEVEVKEDFDEAKELADLLFEDPRVRTVLVVPVVYYKG